MAFIALRPIDLAIFASLGALWIVGVLFVIALYRWIRRFEREETGPTQPELAPSPKPARERPEAVITHEAAREALAAQT
jgi:hypothetical protein